ncbi:hypothetical protein CC78DRAFT_239257 [Lojkania enalia]|uniref:Uncharacterized protein n=1 Tax=Lojkania enalia TaxID=147567 RepID=A0A9P4NAU2_9PLEO|nr:hypothetical protein CC78DRAFT_239257 [Didymosphaeria enalia]
MRCKRRYLNQCINDIDSERMQSSFSREVRDAIYINVPASIVVSDLPYYYNFLCLPVILVGSYVVTLRMLILWRYNEGADEYRRIRIARLVISQTSFSNT